MPGLPSKVRTPENSSSKQEGRDSAPGARRVDIGPSCNLKSIFSASVEEPSVDDGRTANLNLSQKLGKPSTLIEERKANLFYLRDQVLSKEVTLVEKLEAIGQIRKLVHLPVFKLAIEPVLTAFHQIGDLVV